MVWRTIASVLGLISLAFAAHAQQPRTEASQQRHDRLLAAVQGICPVSGEKLGGHGVPMKATFNEGKETLFVCCEACTKEQPNPEHLKKIHARFAEAQGKCLVMGKKLPIGATSTVVKGQRFFLCCPPCAEKIAADSASYVKKIDDAFAAYLKKGS